MNIPPHLPVRPTTDRAKEGLFNILSNWMDFEQQEVLDLFAGTGNMAIEFASRGCKQVTVVDQHIGCIRCIEKTIQTWDIPNINTVRSEAEKYLKKCSKSYDVIFADPPYSMLDKVSIHKLAMSNELLNKDGFLILEHKRGEDYSELPGFYESRNYGDVNFSIFRS